MDLRSPLEPGVATKAALGRVRSRIPFTESDHFLAEDMRVAEELVRTGRLVESVSGVIGESSEDGEVRGDGSLRFR